MKSKLTLNQILVAVVGIGLFVALLSTDTNTVSQPKISINNLEKAVLSPDGVTLPIQWNDLGKQMIEVGVIDQDKFETLYAQRGGLTKDDKKLLYGENNGEIVMNTENSAILLNLLWAFGLSNKNLILEEGPMVSEKYGGDASGFASTGGWGLADGDAMEYYSKHTFIALTEEQQKLVEQVSKNIYRPCCGNSTYFPDCNHGMAMLGLLELLASNNASEKEMYSIALKVNSYWFPDTYLTLAEYFSNQGVEWKNVNPKEVLGFAYSSAQGYMKILEEMEPVKFRGGAGCGV